MTENACPCGSGLSLDACCKPVIDGTKRAPTAEALMRSRYTAYVLQDIDYLKRSLDAEEARTFDRNATESWARDSVWTGLEIVHTSAGTPDDNEGTVEFIAHFEHKGVPQSHHETSLFRKIDGDWRYAGGKEKGPEQVRREAPKVGRNDPCPCGSGKKYKKCCGG